MRILVVDDEAEMRQIIARGLADDGHRVVAVPDGIEAITAESEFQPEAAIVDVMLPGMSGFELTRRLKAARPELVVILLTARDAVDDRVRGLDSGADDYMTKPFHIAELSARLRAIQRRDALAAPQTLTVGSVALDLTRNRATIGAHRIPLSRTEFDVLRVLAFRAGEPVTRQVLLAEVWEATEHIDGNVVDQYMSYLRRKLQPHPTGFRVVTRRNVGYMLVIDDT